LIEYDEMRRRRILRRVLFVGGTAVFGKGCRKCNWGICKDFGTAAAGQNQKKQKHPARPVPCRVLVYLGRYQKSGQWTELPSAEKGSGEMSSPSICCRMAAERSGTVVSS